MATVHAMRFAGQTNASTSGSVGMPGNSPSLAQLPAEHIVCSVPSTPEFEPKFGGCLRKGIHLLPTKPLGLLVITRVYTLGLVRFGFA